MNIKGQNTSVKITIKNEYEFCLKIIYSINKFKKKVNKKDRIRVGRLWFYDDIMFS